MSFITKLNVFPLLGFFLVTSLLDTRSSAQSASCVAGGPVPCLNLQRNEYDSETRAAIFMMGLYLTKSAGGKTGMCVDYDRGTGESPEPSFKLGFSTDAFKTDEDKLKPHSFDVQKKNISHILGTFSKSQEGEKVDIDVTGFADPQHNQSFYKAGVSPQDAVEKSIGYNQSLGRKRAQTIADLFKGDPHVFNAQAHGKASPQLERENAGKEQGLSCPTRRKVVLTVKAHPGELSDSESGGTYFPQNQIFDVKARKEIIAGFDSAMKSAVSSLPRRKQTSDEEVMSAMMSQGSISARCTLAANPVLYALTLAKIKADRSSDNSQVRKASLRASLNTEPLKSLADTVEIKERGIGDPTIVYWCFKMPPSFLKRSYEADCNAMMGTDLITKLKGDSLSDDAKLSVGFDPALVKPVHVHRTNYINPKTTTIQVKQSGTTKTTTEEARTGVNSNDANSGKDIKGFICAGCGHGISYVGAPGHEHMRLADRLFKAEDPGVGPDGKDKAPLITSLNDIASDPTSIAAFSKPRTLIIYNCAKCDCDVKQRVLDGKDMDVIDPAAHPEQPKTMVSVSKQKMATACAFTPPVLPSCMIDPKANARDAIQDSKTFLRYLNPVNGLSQQAENLASAVKAITQTPVPGCDPSIPPVAPKLSYQEMINSVACASNRDTKLPSFDDDGEKADCATRKASR
ncbi:MAG: hypothetical protein H7222_01385 [Methylotenera sp.]|nr:hypothetical protein [Oligoflexia bacterium]